MVAREQRIGRHVRTADRREALADERERVRTRVSRRRIDENIWRMSAKGRQRREIDRLERLRESEERQRAGQRREQAAIDREMDASEDDFRSFE